MRKKHHLLLAAGAAASALSLVAPTTASAQATAPTTTVITTQVVAPFNLAISKGRLYVGDSFAGQVSRVRADGSLRTIVSAPDASGVALSRNGRYLAYTTTEGNQAGITASGVRITGPFGYRASADTLKYEQINNPDKKLTYGVDNPSTCVRRALEAKGFPVKYRGGIDSHAYSVAAYGKKFVLADAGGNDLLMIDRKGNISTIGVLPRHPFRITAPVAKSLGLPNCVIDVTYSFEAVPTDVEVGPDGWLYVTTLPGGPEDPGFPARGRVYRVDPKTGKNQLVARGFAGATNLAFGKNGEIYVAELFGNRISVIKDGKVSPFLNLPGAVSVETDARGRLWAGTVNLAGGPGSIVKINTK